MSEVNDFARQNYIVFIWGQKLSHSFVLVCVRLCVQLQDPSHQHLCSMARWEKNIWCVLKLAEKALVTSHGHFKPVHTHTHNCQRSGLSVKPLVGCQNHLQPPNSYRSVSSSSHLGINPHTCPQREFILHHGPNNLSTRLAPSNWLTGFRNKLPGLSAPRLSQRVRGASESCTDFNKASRTLTRQATPSACDRPAARHPLDPLWFQALFISAQHNFRILHKSPSEQHLPMFIKETFQVKHLKST